MDSEGLFSAWLKRERKQRRLTQQQLGQQISCSADQIRKIEADERRFGEAQARLLAELFGIPTDEIETFVVWSRGGVPPANLTITTESRAVDSAPLTLLDHPAPAPSSLALSPVALETAKPSPLPHSQGPVAPPLALGSYGCAAECLPLSSSSGSRQLPIDTDT